MSQVLAIAGGGAIGALMRFYLAGAVNQWAGAAFPFGTLAVNVLGSGLMGMAFVLFTERLAVPEELRLALMVGVLGAFTTFSTFSIETLGLLQSGHWLRGLANVLASVSGCLIACWFGMLLAQLAFARAG